jgi:hypothetical protein
MGEAEGILEAFEGLERLPRFLRTAKRKIEEGYENFTQHGIPEKRFYERKYPEPQFTYGGYQNNRISTFHPVRAGRFVFESKRRRYVRHRYPRKYKPFWRRSGLGSYPVVYRKRLWRRKYAPKRW